MQSIMNHVNKFSNDYFDYSGIICVVDAKYFLKLSKSLLAISRQLAAANFIFINKTDLTDDSAIETIVSEINKINPYARIHLTSYGQVPEDLLSKIDSQIFAKDLPSTNTVNNRPDVLLLSTDAIINETIIKDFLDHFKGKILRFKGFARYTDYVAHIDVVGNEFISEKSYCEREVSELVVIPFPGISIRSDVDKYFRNTNEWKCEVI